MSPLSGWELGSKGVEAKHQQLQFAL